MENIQNKNIGPSNLVPQHLNTPLQAFELVFKRDFIELIIVNTNATYERFYRQFPRSSQIMHYQGVYKLQNEDLSKLLDCKQAPHFQATISRESYQLLRKFCRFDDTETRNEIKNNKFAFIRKL